jgi:hypothetical protein
MPPRTVRKTAGPGPKRATRSKTTPKGKNQRGVVVEPEKDQEVVPEEVREETNVVVEKNSLDENLDALESKVVSEPVPEVLEPKVAIRAEEKLDDSLAVKKDDDVKETVEEYEKGERLDLDDHELEYEPEEEPGENEHEGLQEERDEDVGDDDVGEEVAEEEGDIIEEEEGDIIEEEGDTPEAEDEEGDIIGDDSHTEMNLDDAVEEQEHHDVFKERRKRKEFEIFVGGLDKDATEEDLKKAFKEVGDIVEIRLMMNPQTKKNKGFAFIRFATVEQAKRACTDLKHPVVHGKKCGVSPSQDSDTLFLGNVCRTWTREALKEKLKHYGVETVEDLTLVEDSTSVGLNRGFAFLEFSSRLDAMDAFKRLQKRDVSFGIDRPAKVSFADSFIDPGDEIMAQVTTVFVDGLLSSWDEDHIRELLKQYGGIDKIELARNMPSARRKDFGFITFDSHDAAVTCAKCINNEELGHGDNKAKVRARLSRPLNRGTGKHAPRGEFRPARGSSTRSSHRGSWGRPAPRSLPTRGSRGGTGARFARPVGIDRTSTRRPAGFRERRPILAPPSSGRRLPPASRSFDRKPPVPAYPKSRSSSYKREYSSRREEPPSRSRATGGVEYAASRMTERRMSSSYRDNYHHQPPPPPPPPRRGGSSGGYVDELPPRRAAATRSTAPRRGGYVDDGYSHQRFERPPPSYHHEGRARDYDSLSGSKRSYAALDDVPPPRYAESGVRHTRARLDYEMGGTASQYGDAYSDRLGRSSLGYGSSSRGSLSGQDSHALYSSRHNGMSYDGGPSYGGSDVGGVYSSSYGSDYMPRGSDVGGGSSYSSLYSSRAMGGSSYMGNGGSGSSYY